MYTCPYCKQEMVLGGYGWICLNHECPYDDREPYQGIDHDLHWGS